ALEQVGQVVGGDTDAVVAHRQLDALVGGARGQDDLAAAGRVLDRVLDQVVEQLPHAVDVDTGHDGSFTLDAQNVAGVGAHLCRVPHQGDDVGHVQLAEQPPPFRPSRVQEIGDEYLESVALANDRIDAVCVGRRVGIGIDLAA